MALKIISSILKMGEEEKFLSSTNLSDHNYNSQLSEISNSEADLDQSPDRDKDENPTEQNKFNEDKIPGNTPPSKISNIESGRETDETSSETSSSKGGKNASGNWGWFEPIEDTEGKNYEVNSSHSKEEKYNDRSKKKKSDFDRYFPRPQYPIVSPISEAESSAMAVTAPTYVLEESRSNQKLWKKSAGNRPPQPVEERAFYEQMWAANFSSSQVKYSMPIEVLTASTPFFLSPFADSTFEEGNSDGVDCTNYDLAVSFKANGSARIGKGGETKEGGVENVEAVKAAVADAAEATLMHGNGRGFGSVKCNNYSLKSMDPHNHHHTLVNEKIKGDGNCDLTVVVRGDNVFGTTVSKSFIKKNGRRARGRPGTVSVSISIGSYRVVESRKHGRYAQFLVIYCEGSFRETVGVWKRHSDFGKLSRRVSVGSDNCAACNPLAIEEECDEEILPNAVASWRLLKKRQRWYRCLDANYLSLKIFLLERFLHDILFESSSSKILRDFVGVDKVDNVK